MIKLTDVSFTYDEQQENGLQNISLHIPKGQFVLLCGESGCGKTTVTRLINGLIPHFYTGELSGRTEVCGMDTANTEIAELSDHIGSVFQNPRTQFFNTDTDSELAFGLENRGLPAENIRERIAEVSRELKIQHLMQRSIFELSGGEKQKIAFASVYTSSPDILVLDEPSSNLDPQSIEELTLLLKKAKAENHTIIIAEHRIWYLMELADRVVFMKDGRIEKDMDIAEFKALPEDERINMGLRCRSLKDIKVQNLAIQKHEQTLSAHDLTVRIEGKVILNKVSFTAHAGEIIAITGRNGAGKTTLARTLCGLQKPSFGQVKTGVTDIRENQRKKQSYMVMQDVNHQLFTDSAEAECKLGIKEIDDAAVQSALDLLDLTVYRDRHPLSLSGGQKQRLAVAVSLLCGKEAVVFDEPTSGLDLRSMREVGELAFELSRRGKFLLVITHDYEFIAAICTRMLCLENGELVSDTPVDSFGTLPMFRKGEFV